MKIVIPGGSGQLGQILARYFYGRGCEVVVLSRRPIDATPWRNELWDSVTLGPWAAELEGADAVINLAGRSVNCRYHARNRREIIDSRIRSTQIVGQAIAACRRPPVVWLQASTATIYEHRYDAPNDEATGIFGGNEPDAPETWRFSIEVATAWERALDQADVPETRKVKLRMAMIMSPDRGGTFDTFMNLVRCGLGGRSGDGRQFMSWIHQYDFCRSVEWLLSQSHVDGAVNLAAPNPLPNSEFMQTLRSTYGARWGLPATNWMIEVGAALLRTESELVLKSRRVVPGRLLAEGFRFKFPLWAAAARDLCHAWRGQAGRSPATHGQAVPD